MSQPSHLRYLVIVLLSCSVACHKNEERNTPGQTSSETVKVRHRLSWDKWFSFGGNDPNKNSLYPNDVEVFWDGQKIGLSDDAIEKLAAMKPDSSWEVIFDMPLSPGMNSPRLQGDRTGAFLEDCTFLTEWYRSGMRLHFERKGVLVAVHYLDVVGSVSSPKRSTSWDNPTYYFDGEECEDGKVAVVLMKKTTWKKGDMLFILFPLRYRVFQTPLGESQMQTWLDELGRVHGVEIIGVNNSDLTWGPRVQIPLPDL
jgi:hypothetical protein